MTFTTYKAFKWIVGVELVDCFPKADSLDHVLEDLELLRLNSADGFVVETETLETVPCDKPVKIGFWHEPLKKCEFHT